ncbi:transcriptional regulator [Luteimonas sp. MJ293]|uniref:helix-turn-helix domain-containing protein n=1 Tax=Luteimonas sp. MJ146 TaxID=3129240 RepID=UPI0031BACD86
MKRDVFAELLEGFDALEQERAGKVTLRSHKVQLQELEVLSADELVRIREHLKMSRPVFAMYLRTNPRTLENWEQGRAKPNAQATTLIRLVQKYPETVEHLASLA